MTFVDFARHRQGYRGRQDSPITCRPPQDGSFAFACPGCCQWFQKRKAKFIKEHHDCAEPSTLFLSWASLFPARLSQAFHPARLPEAVAFERYSLTYPVH